MNEKDAHKCFICKDPTGYKQTPESRYPNAICVSCCGNAKNEQGDSVTFANVDIWGGLVVFVNGQKLKDFKSGHYKCYINSVECHASDARFGGVVIQPVFKL